MKKNHRLILALEILASVLFLAIALITDLPPLENTWYGNALSILAFFMLLSFWACLKLERFGGSYECSVCGQVHTLTDSQKLLCIDDAEKVFVSCPKCEKGTWHEKF